MSGRTGNHWGLGLAELGEACEEQAWSPCTLLPVLKACLHVGSPSCRLTLVLGCIGLTDGAPDFSSPVKQAKERCFDLLTLPSLLIYSANTSYLRGNGTPVELGPSHGETHSLLGKSPQKMAVESLR